MSDHSLSDQQIEHYRTEGYLVFPEVFGKDELEQVDRTIRELADHAIESGHPEKILELEPEPYDDQPVPRRIYHPFEQHECFRNLATDARILDRIESLIGPDIMLHHSKLNAPALNWKRERKGEG